MKSVKIQGTKKVSESESKKVIGGGVAPPKQNLSPPTMPTPMASSAEVPPGRGNAVGTAPLSREARRQASLETPKRKI